jgi:hypothetical protein
VGLVGESLRPAGRSTVRIQISAFGIYPDYFFCPPAYVVGGTMGKTRRTYRDALLDERSKWANARRWLRRQHQPTWDNMWVHAEDYADAIGEANPRNPMFGALMAICLGQQKEIERLKENRET